MNDSSRPVYGPPEPASPLLADPVRTDMCCTNCSKNFIAQLDLSVDGNLSIVCPWCEHEHQRVVTKGVVTEGRWGHSGNIGVNVRTMSVWKSATEPVMTSIASHFIREKWLSRGDVDLGRIG